MHTDAYITNIINPKKKPKKGIRLQKSTSRHEVYFLNKQKIRSEFFLLMHSK